MRSLFPMFVKLEGRAVLVVGAGKVAEAKIRGLLDTGAYLRVVAPQANETVREWSRRAQIIFEERTFAVSDLDQVFVVVAATGSPAVNKQVFLEAQARGVLCNVVDVPELCDFFYPAVIRRGNLQIAISTSGQSPSLAQRLREQLEREFGPGWAEWVERLGETRREVLSSELDAGVKRQLLQSLASREAFEASISRARLQSRRGR
jgi:precorrin-2 dehydrogenase / sirohydrochlorin ferrochelatase